MSHSTRPWGWYSSKAARGGRFKQEAEPGRARCPEPAHRATTGRGRGQPTAVVLPCRPVLSMYPSASPRGGATMVSSCSNWRVIAQLAPHGNSLGVRRIPGFTKIGVNQ